MTQPIPCFSGFTLSVHRQEGATVAQVQPPRKPGHHSAPCLLPSCNDLYTCRRAPKKSPRRTMLWPLLRAALLVEAALGAAGLDLQVPQQPAHASGEPGKSRQLKGRFLHITGKSGSTS